jgi:tol-pal system-associated acyl-CoA thioesterase
MSGAGPHRYAVRVYVEDTDAGGIVYHANHLRFAARARTATLRERGIARAGLVERFNLMFVVRRAELDYQRPARLDDSLIVLTEPLRVGGASVALRPAFIGAGSRRRSSSRRCARPASGAAAALAADGRCRCPRADLLAPREQRE